MEFTGFTQGIPSPGSGVTARAMASEFRAAPMGAAMLGSSSAASSTALDATILGQFWIFLNSFSIFKEISLFFFLKGILLWNSFYAYTGSFFA